MRAADTNVVVRVIVRDDEKQVALAEAFIARGAWISTLVLVETLWVLEHVYELSHIELVRTIESLLVHAQFVLQDADAVSAAIAHFRRTAKNGFADYLILEVARKNGHLPLGTFDKSLAKIEGAQKL